MNTFFYRLQATWQKRNPNLQMLAKWYVPYSPFLKQVQKHSYASRIKYHNPRPPIKVLMFFTERIWRNAWFNECTCNESWYKKRQSLRSVSPSVWRAFKVKTSILKNWAWKNPDHHCSQHIQAKDRWIQKTSLSCGKSEKVTHASNTHDKPVKRDRKVWGEKMKMEAPWPATAPLARWKVNWEDSIGWTVPYSCEGGRGAVQGGWWQPWLPPILLLGWAGLEIK